MGTEKIDKRDVTWDPPPRAPWPVTQSSQGEWRGADSDPQLGLLGGAGHCQADTTQETQVSGTEQGGQVGWVCVRGHPGARASRLVQVAKEAVAAPAGSSHEAEVKALGEMGSLGEARRRKNGGEHPEGERASRCFREKGAEWFRIPGGKW